MPFFKFFDWGTILRPGRRTRIRRSISRTSSSVMRAPSIFIIPAAGALFAVEIFLRESGVG